MKPVRGRSYWFPFPQHGAATAHMMTEGEEGSTGFRLVHEGSYRVCRGGSWLYSARSARVADRDGLDPAYRNDDLGFRLVREEEG